MPKLDLSSAFRIKHSGGELLALKGAGFSWAYVNSLFNGENIIHRPDASDADTVGMLLTYPAGVLGVSYSTAAVDVLTGDDGIIANSTVTLTGEAEQANAGAILFVNDAPSVAELIEGDVISIAIPFVTVFNSAQNAADPVQTFTIGGEVRTLTPEQSYTVTAEDVANGGEASLVINAGTTAAISNVLTLPSVSSNLVNFTLAGHTASNATISEITDGFSIAIDQGLNTYLSFTCGDITTGQSIRVRATINVVDATTNNVRFEFNNDDDLSSSEDNRILREINLQNRAPQPYVYDQTFSAVNNNGTDQLYIGVRTTGADLHTVELTNLSVEIV